MRRWGVFTKTQGLGKLFLRVSGTQVPIFEQSLDRDGDKRVAGRNENEQHLPQNEGSMVCPPGKSIISFYK